MKKKKAILIDTIKKKNAKTKNKNRYDINYYPKSVLSNKRV